MGQIKSDMNQTPRKVRVATTVFDTYEPYPGLSQRMGQTEDLVREAVSQAERTFGTPQLDIVVLPEDMLGFKQEDPFASALDYERDVRQWAGELASQHRIYLVLPMLRFVYDSSGNRTVRNSAFLIDRTGETIGVSDKIHPVLDDNGEMFENGVTPGSEVAVFACDFGKVGMQICFDMDFDDGWSVLEAKGAELVLWPTESPQTIRPAWRALHGDYYIVSATSRKNATVFSPIGLPLAQVVGDRGVLVHEIDLSYARLNFSHPLREGGAVTERWGDAAGYVYSDTEDMGLFWSNDPDRTIGSMLKELNLDCDLDEMTDRNEDKLRPYRPLR